MYTNAIHFNPLQFCPFMSLLGFPVFCLSSIVLSRYFDILVNSMSSCSVLKLPKIALPSSFNFSLFLYPPTPLLLARGAGLAQWWERSPSTNVSRVRFPDPASHVGWVCWLSTLLREVFFRVLRFSPLLKNLHLIYLICLIYLIWFIWFTVSPISRALMLS